MNDELEQFYVQNIAETHAAYTRRIGLLHVEVSRLRGQIDQLQHQLQQGATTQMMGESDGLSGDE